MEFTELSEITEVISQTSREKKEVGHVQWKSNEADISFQLHKISEVNDSTAREF